MKKGLFAAILLSAASFTVKAQKPEAAQVLVHYKFSHIRDTANRAHPYTEDMVLFVGKTAGAYKSYDKIAADEKFKKEYAAAVASSPDGRIMINRRNAGTPVQYYMYPNEQKLFIIESQMMNSYLLEGPIPAVDWKISADTATFGGLHCQKASTNFKGRNYTVWFCPDLPVRVGPWKLSGLPGVIVDARDEKNEVLFQFDGIEKAAPVSTRLQPPGGSNSGGQERPAILQGMDDDPSLIAPPAGAIKTTQREFDKLRAAIQKNPNAVMQGMNAVNGPKGDIMIKRMPGPAEVMNNPIELPDKN